jgi:hypothetical protein
VYYKKLLVYILIFLVFNLNACSHSKSLSNTDVEKDYNPKSGDKVEILTKNGDQYKLILIEVSEDSIKSNKYNIAINDIQTIKKTESHPYILVGILGGIGLLYIIGKQLSGGIGPH